MCGEKNGMFNKHHSEETKIRISNKLNGRIISKEAKIKIGNFHKNKVLSIETKQKISEKRKLKLASKEIIVKTKGIIVKNIITGEIYKHNSLPLWCEENNFSYSVVKTNVKRKNNIHKKYFIEYAAINSDVNSKLGELLETPEVDNQQLR